ncbi:type III-A CRISPR-associated RAMP protein Csm4 [Thermodesulfovibrio sp. TK110]
MQSYFYKLRFKDPVHFGETGIYLENVVENFSSDSLFSALINAVSIYYEANEVQRWIENFMTDPPFLLSSLFIYNLNNYFLPRPFDDSFISADLRKKVGKELKKIRWLEANDFIKWQMGKITKLEDINSMKEKLEYYDNAFKKEVRPRVTIDRDTSQSSIYFCGSIRFQKEAGLYGLVAFREEKFIEEFKTALKLLGQTGIGGERTFGYGMFEVEEFKPVDGVFEKILKSDASAYTLLSLYHPSDEEMNILAQKLIAYTIKRKKGWITSGRTALAIKRKSVGFLKEGSVLAEPVRGAMVDVTPEEVFPQLLTHRVYRYGYAFTVPLKE